MIGIIRIVWFHRATLGIFNRWIAVWIVTGNLCKFGIHLGCFLLIGLSRVEVYYSYHLRIAIFRGQSPWNLHNGTVYLDAHEVLGLSCYWDCCLESDDTIDIWHGSSTNESITFPSPRTIPTEIIGSLAILHDGRYAVIIICHGILTINGLLLCLLVLGKFWFGSAFIRLQCCDAVFVGIVLLTIPRSIIHIWILDFSQKFRIFCLQVCDFWLERSYFPLCLRNLGINLWGVDTFMSDTCGHSTLLGVTIYATSTTRTLVLGWRFTKFGTAMAGNTDGCSFTSCNLLGIGCLIVSLCITWKIVGVTFLVIIEFFQSCIQSGFERVHVHCVGIKDILIGNFLFIPALWNMNLVSIGFSILTTFLLTENIAWHIVGYAIIEAVIRVVMLLNITSTPSSMAFWVSQCSFSFCRCWSIVFVLCADTIPVITFDDGIIVCRWIVVAQLHITGINSIDIPSLGVVLSHSFTGIVCYPRGQIVVR